MNKTRKAPQLEKVKTTSVLLIIFAVITIIAQCFCGLCVYGASWNFTYSSVTMALCFSVATSVVGVPFIIFAVLHYIKFAKLDDEKRMKILIRNIVGALLSFIVVYNVLGSIQLIAQKFDSYNACFEAEYCNPETAEEYRKKQYGE